MLSNKSRELINSALLNLQLEDPTQVVIDKASNYLREAIAQIRREKEEGRTEEPQEYKVWLFNALYDTNYVENEFVNALTGSFQSQNT